MRFLTLYLALSQSPIKNRVLSFRAKKYGHAIAQSVVVTRLINGECKNIARIVHGRRGRNQDVKKIAETRRGRSQAQSDVGV